MSSRSLRDVALPLVLALAVWSLGFWGFQDSCCAPGATLTVEEAAYRSLELFAPGHDQSGLANSLDPKLVAARWLAPLLTLSVLLVLLAEGVRRVLGPYWQGLSRRPRYCVVGEGAIADALTGRLAEGGARLTVLGSRQPNGAAPRRAFHLTADPDEATQHRAARLHRADRVFVARPNDLATLETAQRVARFLRKKAPTAALEQTLRVVLRDPEIARLLPVAVAAGVPFGGFSTLSLYDEAARELARRARWSEAALDKGQDRVHVVILGAGGQGMAVGWEAMLAGWRVGLKAPRVTFLDRDAVGAEQELRLRAPFLFDEGARSELPSLRFHQVTADAFDVNPHALEAFGIEPDSISGWVAACGNDDLNLRFALRLLRAMRCDGLPTASIHTRFWAGHRDAVPDLGFRNGAGEGPVSTFGALQQALGGRFLMTSDPDEPHRQLHEAHARARAEAVGGDDRMPARPWDALSESMKAANRRLYRLAPAILADLGFPLGAAARVTPAHAARVVEAERTIDWCKRPSDGLAQRVFDAARCEHSRWVTDRALDGWRQAPDGLRNDALQFHDSMVPWNELSLPSRRYDGVLVCAVASTVAKEGSVRR